MEAFKCLIPVLFILQVAIDQVAMEDSVDMHITLFPSDSKIFMGEKTVVNMSIQWLQPIHEEVTVVIYPTMDIPDFVITKVTDVRVGANLQLTGSLAPEMDFGVESLQNPGMSLSCQFKFGTIKKLRRGTVPVEDDSIMVQYEAMVPLGRYEDMGAGHEHKMGLFIYEGTHGMNVTMCQRDVMFAIRSIPLLFQSLDDKWPKNRYANEMDMKKTDQAKQPYRNMKMDKTMKNAFIN